MKEQAAVAAQEKEVEDQLAQDIADKKEEDERLVENKKKKHEMEVARAKKDKEEAAVIQAQKTRDRSYIRDYITKAISYQGMWQASTVQTLKYDLHSSQAKNMIKVIKEKHVCILYTGRVSLITLTCIFALDDSTSYFSV
jgi:hypothetical protein